jgi:hypothetical protein
METFITRNENPAFQPGFSFSPMRASMMPVAEGNFGKFPGKFISGNFIV